MLKSISVIIYIMIVIIWISKKLILFSKYVNRTYILFRQKGFVWVFNFKHIFFVIIHAFAGFITQISVYILIAHNFYRIFYVHGTMVGRNYNFYFFMR